MSQHLETSSSTLGALDAGHLSESALVSPEPTTAELNLRRAKLAFDIEAALKRYRPLRRPEYDE